VRRSDNLTTFMCPSSRNFGSLNLLEPEAPLQACIGIAYLFLFHSYHQHEFVRSVHTVSPHVAQLDAPVIGLFIEHQSENALYPSFSPSFLLSLFSFFLSLSHSRSIYTKLHPKSKHSSVFKGTRKRLATSGTSLTDTSAT